MWPAPTTPRLRRMIEQAMKDQAPSLHRELEASGLLEQEINDRVAVTHEARSEALGAAGSPFNRATNAQECLQAMSVAWEVGLAAGLEFPPES